MFLGSATSHRDDIRYVPKYVVAQSGSGSLKTNVSTDGISWTQYTSSSNGVQQIIYGNGRYVRLFQGVPGNTFIQISYDGITWINSSFLLSLNQGCVDICYGNGKFVIVFDTGLTTLPPDFAYSSDGLNWISGYLPNRYYDNAKRDISFGSGYFISGQSKDTTPPYINKIEISNDGTVWNSSTLPSSAYSWTSFSGNNKLFAKHDLSNTYVSDDFGTTWPNTTAYLPTVFGNGTYLSLILTSIHTSTNLITWTARSNPYSLNNIIFANGQFIGVDITGTTVAVSGDGVTWTALTTTAPNLASSAGIAFG